MSNLFLPNLRPALIGSLPLDDHAAATRLMFEQVPQIPLWVQLPKYPQEGMMEQFLPGFPGLQKSGDKIFIDTHSPDFEAAVMAFYEEYLAICDDPGSLAESRFKMDAHSAAGFFEFLTQAESRREDLFAVKGQITGPFTFATGVVDADGRAVFYDAQLRDIAVKLIALKARWQAQQLAFLGKPVILFFDEPGLTAFGSSAFISISYEEVQACFEEVMEAVQAEGALTGVHVCANAEWSLILDSRADIVSFDAYFYFDKFILYPKEIENFIGQGKILAWGLIPTSDRAEIEKVTVASLVAAWDEKVKVLESMGFDRATIQAQSLITPSCGTGSLDAETAQRVLELTAGVSQALRQRR